MRKLKSVLAAAVGTAALLGSVAQLSAASGPVNAAGHHHRVHRDARRISWAEHDRAVYAVSTLNAPLCSNGQQLSTVLWNVQGARLFDVLRSPSNHGLYFVQVRDADARLIGVYSYRFGAKLPSGIQSSRCVAVAPAGAVTAYKHRAWKFVARFTSTYPQD